VNGEDRSSNNVASVGAAVFENLAQFREHLIERVREVNAMTEKEVMGAADDVHTIFGAASAQIAQLRTLLGGGKDAQGESNVGGDELSASIDEELKSVAEFAAELNREVTEQLRLTRAAEKSLSDITSAAAQVGTFANRAKMLALNARIEASRDSQNSRGFAVIADQMKELSRGVAETNASIQELARVMATLLPGIVHGANSMHTRSRDFSDKLQLAMRSIGEQSNARRREVAAAVDQSDQALSQIVSSSQSALSHLQFQDAVAQGLMRLDAALVDTQKALCTAAGLHQLQARIAPPIHIEIGGEKSVNQQHAGEVMMF
jgi:methyl-accepting chemotaxis protein